MGLVRHGLVIGFTAVLVAMVCALVGWAGETNESSAPSRALDLQVVTREAKKPVAGAKLEIRIDRETRSEVTDDQGRYRIEYGPQQPDYISVRASGQGLVPVQAAWHMMDPSVKIPDAYTLTMEPGTSIGGIIQDEDGKPIENVTVYLLAPSDSTGIERVSIWDYPVKTDSGGRWRCDIMPAWLDEIWIRLDHPDYISDEMYGKTPKPPIEQLRDMTGVMVMKKGVTVAGQVVDMNDRPIEGASVAQGSDRFGSEYPSTRTDNEGRFQFANARPGQMVLTVQASGYSPELETIVIGNSLEPVRFRLEPGHTLRGQIVDKGGNPIVGAFVAADTWRGHRSLSWRVDTDAQGRFRWNDAPADEVLVDMGKQYYMSIRHYGMTASDQEYTITMNPVLRVKGRIVDAETGRPIPKFTLYPGIDWGDGRPVYWERRQAKAFADGVYEIMFSEPRLAHLIRVEAEGYLPGVSRSFEDGEGQVEYDLKLKKGAGLSGTIRFPDGQPVAGAEVVLCTPSQTVFIRNGRNEQRRDSVSVQTGQDGRFTFPPEADEYRLVVLHDRGYAEVTGEDLAASSDVTLQPWGRVEGTLRIGSKPGAGEGVRVMFDRPFERGAPDVQYDCSAVADEEGRFVLDRVPPGKARACRQFRLNDRMTLFSHDVPIEVKAGETTTVTIGGTGRPVIGKVAIPDPVKDKLDWGTLDYHVRNQSPEGANRTLGMKFERDGTFRVDDVPAGDYLLRFSAYAPAEQPRGFRGEPIGSLNHPFTVPEMPGGRRDEPLDLGVLELPVLGGAMAGPFLVGKQTPDLQRLKLGLPPEELNGKRLLICFFDVGQRPSRNAVLQIAKQAQALKAKDIVPVAVQVAAAEETALKAWLQENAITLPLGVMPDGQSMTCLTWGVRSLPWLILTDAQHVVQAEGFGIDELHLKIQGEKP
jgi:protocatechuate 3,4-dioxygenase beta subunit